MSGATRVRSLSVNVKSNVWKNSNADCVSWERNVWFDCQRKKRRLNVMEKKCLRSICGVTIRDRIRNERNYEKNRSSSWCVMAKRCALRCFGHVERMSDERIIKRVYESEVEERWERPKSVWMDEVRKALNNRGLTLEQEKWLCML